MANLLLSKLNNDAAGIAERFQRLAVQSYRSRCQEWPGAHALLQELAGRIQCLTHSSNGLSDPLAVARTLNINVRFFESRVPKLCGALYPIAGGFETAVYRRSGTVELLSAEERFTIAHECGHAFFYYLDGGMPKRILPRLLSPRWPLDAISLEEDLCDSFARALLVPLGHAHFSPKTTSMTELLGFARDYKVPLDVLLVRIIRDLKAWPQTAVYRLRFADSEVHVDVIQSDLPKDPPLVPRASLVAHIASGELDEDVIARLKKQFQLGEEHIVANRNVIWLRM